MVKVYLSRKGVPFVEYNVSRDREALKELVGMGYRTTPVTVVGGQSVVGYAPAGLEAALIAADIAGSP